VDISKAVLFLAPDEAARYITGVTLPVDAGASVK
jgi:(+)-trans-carveol dehydrogenase